MHRMIRHSLFAALLLCCAIGFSTSGAAENSVDSKEAAAVSETPEFVAYYFHGNFRCATCRKLEAYSEEAIFKGFAKDLESGALEWRAVNTDEPANKHYVQDFQLLTKSLVLVEYRDGEVARFENLKEIWQKVGDKDGFLEYVRTSTREFIGKG